MTLTGSLLLTLLVPGILSLYALAFTAGGIYYLEQRVSRIRDQFPRRTSLSLLTGIAALCIGLLMALAVAGHFWIGGIDFRMAALVAVVAGVGFWVYHIYFDQTPLSCIRDSALAFICLALVAVAAWWVEFQ
ncbi:MAG: hypothetical protein JW934_19755 [Anaerolineae bacterium]|nr:hypothetical protein [Anaerolineae bacterium]